jgi:hypothetical protein
VCLYRAFSTHFFLHFRRRIEHHVSPRCSEDSPPLSPSRPPRNPLSEIAVAGSEGSTDFSQWFPTPTTTPVLSEALRLLESLHVQAWCPMPRASTRTALSACWPRVPTAKRGVFLHPAPPAPGAHHQYVTPPTASRQRAAAEALHPIMAPHLLEGRAGEGVRVEHTRK